MYSNPDWDMASKRLAAFWQKEIIDRPCLQIFVHKEPEATEQTPGTKDLTAEQLWTDPSAFLQDNRQRYMHTEYLGEAFPVLYPNAEHVAIAMGSEVQYDFGTIWIHKTPGDLADLDFSSVTPQHGSIRQMADYFERLATLANGECFVGFPHMGNSGDTLARMRGYGTLCIDLYDNPERCFQLEEQILRIWKMSFDMLYRIINQKMTGSCGWLPAWHPGRCALIEFDFCALISPGYYKKYIPFLAQRAAYADHAIYHLDGPDALKHLDTILGMDEIGFIQWEPGAGSGDILAWIPLMQKIQAAGKGLYVSGGPHSIEKARILLKELRPEGLMLPVSADSVNEAERFLYSAVISRT